MLARFFAFVRFAIEPALEVLVSGSVALTFAWTYINRQVDVFLMILSADSPKENGWAKR